MEFLNLYLDHEIGARELARFEEEVMNNPERRRLYREYCRLHRACAVLAEQSRGEAPVPEEARVAVFPPPQARAFGGYAAGLLAAACVAVIFVMGRLHQAPPAAPAAPAVVAQSDRSGPAPGSFAPVASFPNRLELQPVFSLRAAAPVADNSATAALLTPAELNNPFAWMNRVQLAPLQAQPLDPTVFDSAPLLFGADNRGIRSPQSLPSPVERASFQFQR